MARLQRLLVNFEESHYVHLLNYDDASARRLKVLAEMQARYDRLAGVRERES